MKRGRTAPKPRTAPKRQKTVFVRKQQFARAIVERKYFDSVRTGVSVLTSTTDWTGAQLDPATLNCLFAPIQGDDINNRQGRKVQVLAIKLQGQIGCNPQALQVLGDVGCIIRLHLVQDNQTNGAQLFAQQVIGAAVAGEPTDMYQNPAFFGRFKVLKTLKFKIDNPALGTTPGGLTLIQQGLVHLFKMNVKFNKPVVVHYNSGNAGTVADIVDNSFHVIGITNDDDLAPLIAYRCRTTFIDV